ncbi:MAG: translocation/assembly module TamB domain-containing protein [Pseudomonadota bacterium]
MLLLLLMGIGWWAGSEGSLQRALLVMQRLLPADQTLVVSNVKGSLSGGGRIGRLQWSKPGTTVTIDDLQLEWSLRQLFGRDLRVHTLAIRNMHVRLTPQPDDAEPLTMPKDVSLPIRVTLPLSIARIQIESSDAKGVASTQVFANLSAQYRYDGRQHALRLSSLQYGQSHLQADAQLHARNLTLSAQVAASLRDLTPDTPFAMLARLQVNGNLAGGDAARLDLQLDARQQAHDAPPPDAANLLVELASLRTNFGDTEIGNAGPAAADAQVHVQAILHPWRTQPAQQVDVQISRLNAHAFHSRAPVTLAHGRATLQPVGDTAAAWDAVLDFRNDQPGAWDLQQLPLRKLTATVHLSPELVNIDNARADLGGRTSAGTLMLKGQIPLKQLTRTTLQLDLLQVDLRPLLTSLPHTAFTGPIAIKPSQNDSWQAQADIRNALPGPLDRERVPLERLLADLRMTSDRWRAETLELQIGKGRVQVQGEYRPITQALDLRGELQHLPLRQMHRKMANDLASELSGKLTVAGTLRQGLAFNADLASSAGTSASEPRGQWEIRSLQTSGKWSPTRLTVEQVHLDAFQATMDGGDIDVVLPGFDSIKARISAAAPGIKLEANAAMLQQSGEGRLSVQLASAEQVVTWLRGLPFVGSRLPAWRADGAAALEVDWRGGWKQWLAGFRNPATQPQLHMNANAQTNGLRIDFPAIAGQPPTHIDVQKLDLNLQGNLAVATLAINGDARANDIHGLLDIHMRATQVRGTGSAPHWNIAVEKFVATANLPKQDQSWQLQLSDNLQLSVQPGADFELRASAGDATLSAPSTAGAGSEPLKLAWQPALWRRTAAGAMTLQSIGTATGIQPAWVDMLLAKNGEGPLAAAGMRTDLSLSGDWDIQMTDRVNIRAHLKRERGDLWLLEPETAAGIRTFDVTAQSTGDNVNLDLNWDTERAGVITAHVGTRLTQRSDGWSLPGNAPLSGTVQANLQNLTTWAFLAPPGRRIAGALDANVRLGGTVQKPQLNGDITGKGLNFRSILDGVDLHDGTLRATLNGSRMEIAELSFQGGTGSRAYVRGFSGNRTQPSSARGLMTARGSIDWSGVANASAAESGIVMDVRAELQKMQVLVRNDRQMTLSGELSAGLNQGTLRVRGDIRVDRASIVLPETSAPKLGDDVVIVRNADLKNPGAVEARQTRGELTTRKPMDMEIKLDLGSDLALEGQGITTRLEGELTVRSATYGSDPFSVFGEVRTVEGRYRAWGQALNVETGVVRFNGPYSNPSLNLLAIRPEIDVRAGVRVTGTLNAPRVQLYSDPDLPEGEKLSWVVLGRATVVAGAEGTSMQQAALGLAAGQLSGKLASGIGVDELGLAETGVTVGKRLSNELYLTYEQGLSGAASTLFIFYDITRRLTLRAQTGEASAVDMIYTIKYD